MPRYAACIAIIFEDDSEREAQDTLNLLRSQIDHDLGYGRSCIIVVSKPMTLED